MKRLANAQSYIEKGTFWFITIQWAIGFITARMLTFNDIMAKFEWPHLALFFILSAAGTVWFIDGVISLYYRFWFDKGEISKSAIELSRDVLKFVYKRTTEEPESPEEIEKFKKIVMARYYKDYSPRVVSFRENLARKKFKDKELEMVYRNPANLGHIQTIGERCLVISEIFS